MCIILNDFQTHRIKLLISRLGMEGEIGVGNRKECGEEVKGERKGGR